ncbi:MAG: response regulator [Candidatus Omnitrophica bacterium]|nr:response regulator [Candidatus Omnitrophota bacterium]
MEKETVLIVDDEASIRTTLRKFLESLGVKEILEASNGLEALERVQAAPHLKLVLLDLKMPGMDGVQAFQEIRKILPEVKIAVLTGYPFYRGADEALKKWGALDFITKPADLDYLERVISLALKVRFL